MKQTVSTTTMFKVVLIFTFLFAAFLALAITYNKVYKMKNESVSIIEKYEGATTKSLTLVNNYLKNNGYKTTGDCYARRSANQNVVWYGMRSLDEVRLEPAVPGEQYYYCVSEWCNNSRNCTISSSNLKNEIFYDLKLFFKFNLPFLGDLLTFDINGETKGINLYSENQKLD